MKGTKKYEKPLLIVEKFTPNEYVAACWYVNADDVFTVSIRRSTGISTYI